MPPAPIVFPHFRFSLRPLVAPHPISPTVASNWVRTGTADILGVGWWRMGATEDGACVFARVYVFVCLRVRLFGRGARLRSAEPRNRERGRWALPEGGRRSRPRAPAQPYGPQGNKNAIRPHIGLLRGGRIFAPPPPAAPLLDPTPHRPPLRQMEGVPKPPTFYVDGVNGEVGRLALAECWNMRGRSRRTGRLAQRTTAGLHGSIWEPVGREKWPVAPSNLPFPRAAPIFALSCLPTQYAGSVRNAFHFPERPHGG